MVANQPSINSPDPRRIESQPETQQELSQLRTEVEESAPLTLESTKEVVVEKLKEIAESIPFIKTLFPSLFEEQSQLDRDTTTTSEQINTNQGLTLDQAKSFVSQNENLSFMRGGRFSLDYLYGKAQQFNRTPPNPVQHNFNALASARSFPHNNGRLCCAHYVSTILGIPQAPGSTRGSFGSVNENLVPFLMRRNMDRNNGNPGVVFGYKNMTRGDVIVFRGTEEHAPDRYGHVGIVRDTFVFQGVKYLAMQHNSRTINVEIIPIDPPDANTSALKEVYDDPTQRSRIPALQSIYQYRISNPDTVRFRSNAGYYGDASIPRSGSRRPPRASFAIRTI